MIVGMYDIYIEIIVLPNTYYIIYTLKHTFCIFDHFLYIRANLNIFNKRKFYNYFSF